MRVLGWAGCLALCGWWALPGCAYIIGPPDIGEVPDNVPLDSVAPTDETRGPSADTAKTTPPDSSPSVSDIEVLLTDEGVALQLVIDDYDGDLLGGTVVWTEGLKTSAPISIPAGLDSWQPETGTAVISLPGVPPENCDDAYPARTISAQVMDASGNSSRDAIADLDVSLVDMGARTGMGREQLGEVPLPALLCGMIRQDRTIDRWGFQAIGDGAWTFELTSDGDVITALLRGGVPNTTVDPDDPSFTADLTGSAHIDMDIERVKGNSAGDDAFQLWIHR